MPSILNTSWEEERYSLGIAAIDASVGLVILVPVVPVALALGGFMFIEPWLIFIPLLAFAGGVIRGNTVGNIWLKAPVVNLCALLYSSSNRDIRELTIGAILTVVPCMGGIAVRRRFHRQDGSAT